MASLLDHTISAEELLPLLRERLDAGQKVRFLPFRGISMLPMLRQGKDAVELSPLPDRLKKYDLPVYQYPNGKIVMHRVVAVREDHYLCLGDNTFEYEKIYPDQLIALVSGFRRGARYIPVESKCYRLYAAAWVASYPLRKSLKRGKRLLKKLLKLQNKVG